MKKFVCTVCGYVYEGEAAPAECPICHAPAEKFKEQSADRTWAAEHVVGVAQGAPEDIMADLRANFEGECSEVGMYLAMARVAHREGYPEIGLYWEKAAYEEAEHAAKFAELLGEVVTDSTKKNLEMRVAAESGACAGKKALAAKAKADDAFADVIFEAETYFRKELSVNDIEILIYIHDQLGFSTEVMEYLIEYCVSIDKLDLRYAEGIAKNWYKAGIHTLDEAKEAAENGTPLYRAVFKALGINRKAPTTGEIAWMDSWNKEMGFDLPIIIEACNRGIAQHPNDVTFAYVNGILKRWKKQGVKSIDDIEKASNQFHEDKKKSSQKANQYTVKPNAFNSFQQKDMSSALDEMEQLFLDEINSR